MTEEEMISELNDIPSDGEWWTSDAQSTYRSLAKELVGYGLKPEQAVGVLSAAYWAAASEFGE